MSSASPAAPAIPTFVSADEVWLNGWRGPSMLRVEGTTVKWVGPLSDSPEIARAHVPGTIFGGFTDSHVHLGLIDPAGLVAGGIARVVDLGNDPVVVSALSARAARDPTAVAIEFAGAFLAAPGGYPSDRSWAKDSWLREVSTPDESAAAIAEMRGAGASRIKITLNSVGSPVFTDEMLTTVVAQSHAAGLPVTAHPEGPGQAVRAATAGVDVLAHTPWTERLSDDEVGVLARSVAITSTLDIHGYGDYSDEFAVASYNLARFIAASGRVLYGTDLGNGPLPLGINSRELAALAEAGVGLDGLASALVPDASSANFAERISWILGIPPADPTAWVPWYSSTSVLAINALKETFA